MAFYPVVRLSHRETWAQMRDPHTKELIEFDNKTDATEWVYLNYPSWIKPDIFHGLCPIHVLEQHDRIQTIPKA